MNTLTKNQMMEGLWAPLHGDGTKHFWFPTVHGWWSLCHRWKLGKPADEGEGSKCSLCREAAMKTRVIE